MKKITICIINKFGYNLYNKNCKEETIGGAEVQLFLLSNELIKDPMFDVHVITGKYIHKTKKLELYNKIKLYQVLPIRYFPNSKTFFYIINFFKTLIEINPDILIQRTSGITTALCALYCKFFRKKFIYSIANEPEVNGEAAKGLFGKLYRFGLFQASYIVAQSLEQIKILEKWQNRKFSNISVIRSGYYPVPSNHRSKNTILWVARAERFKRPEIFLDLAKNFPNNQFVMICNKSSSLEYWKEIKSKADKIPNLIFVPFVSFDKINEYFINSKIFINTSIYEGFPNTFIQAIKNKTPILSLNINPDNFLTKYKCGIACGNDFEQLVHNLDLFLSDHEVYYKFSQNALSYFKKNHDMHGIRMDWIDLVIKLNSDNNLIIK